MLASFVASNVRLFVAALNPYQLLLLLPLIMDKIPSRTAIAPRFLSGSSFITDYSLPTFRTYGKNSKVIVAFKDGNVERGRILEIYTESTHQDNSDAEDRNIRYSYDILTRQGVIKKFGCENVLDAECLPVKEE